MKRGMLKSTAAAAAIFAGVAGGYLYRGEAMASPSPAPVEGSQPAPPVAARPSTAALPDFSNIVERYGPAVVNVSTMGTIKTATPSAPLGQLDPNDPFYEFFKHFRVPEQRGETITRGVGSGFIVKSDGVILTNAHVVAGAREVKVKLTDRREFPAKVVGVDKATDVAVLKIDAKNLPTVKIGDSTRVRVGEWVLAIGSPFGFENSATAGIVSARQRSLPDEGYVPFLQTDVAVNPGNSGGPLFDPAGEVIGVNSQIYSQSGGYMGVSFAIPIDVAMNVEHQLVEHGQVTRGQLGVVVQDVNQALADSFGLPRPAGALVSSVQEGGPAAKAGLQPGDVIVSLDGNDVASSADLPPRVAALDPGTIAKLGIWRDHQRREIDVRVSGVKEATVARDNDRGAGHGRLGLAVRPLKPEDRQAGVTNGVVVENAEGPAARAGIQSGDAVLALNGTPVTGVQQLRRLVDRSGKHVALLVQRGGTRIYVPVDVG